MRFWKFVDCCLQILVGYIPQLKQAEATEENAASITDGFGAWFNKFNVGNSGGKAAGNAGGKTKAGVAIEGDDAEKNGFEKEGDEFEQQREGFLLTVCWWKPR